jgi:hypothetical protein
LIVHDTPPGLAPRIGGIYRQPLHLVLTRV